MRLSLHYEFAIISIAGVILLILTGFGDVLPDIFFIPRAVIGLPFVLIIPGYWIQSAVYPNRGILDTAERLAMSFGLSIAVILPIVLLFDLLLHVPLNTVSIFVGEGLLLIIVGGFSWSRRRVLPEGERFLLAISFNIHHWWRSQTTFDRWLTVTLITIMVMTLSIVCIMLWLINRPPALTEFFLLDTKNRAETYPTSIRLGEIITVNVGITNREHETVAYSIRVQQDDEILTEIATFEVLADQTVTYPVTFTPFLSEGDEQIEFYLFREEQNTPYRSLLLYLTVEG